MKLGLCQKPVEALKTISNALKTLDLFNCELFQK